MNMPKLVPIPIKTKNHPIWKRIWIWITSIRKWKLTENWTYLLPHGGPEIVIPKEFVFDGASIPRPLWAILSPTGLLLIPGLIHDFGYRYDYLWAVNPDGSVSKYMENAGRDRWDELFRKVGLDVNGMAIIDMLAWLALALMGWMAWRSNRDRNEPEIKPSMPIT